MGVRKGQGEFLPLLTFLVDFTLCNFRLKWIESGWTDWSGSSTQKNWLSSVYQSLFYSSADPRHAFFLTRFVVYYRRWYTRWLYRIDPAERLWRIESFRRVGWIDQPWWLEQINSARKLGRIDSARRLWWIDSRRIDLVRQLWRFDSLTTWTRQLERVDSTWRIGRADLTQRLGRIERFDDDNNT